MSGCQITDLQVGRYMNERKDGATQAVAAMKAGISEASGRRIERGRPLASQKPARSYRTRTDPFQEVWRGDVVPILERAPLMRATTVLEELQRLHPARFPDRLLRTLQRHVSHWRATEGPERELIFRQDHPPGRQALSDFTHADTFTVTLAGRSFKHMLYHFWLAFSGWQHVRAIQGGESYTALTEGLQDALWQLGGVPREHRTDRLSAAYRNLDEMALANDDAATGYAAFCKHYGMTPTRNNNGVAHENGAVEAAHGHLKRTIKEALELRGSHDFADLAQYQAFLAELIARKNARRADAVALELKALGKLPRHRTTDFSVATVTVVRSGTITVRGVLYSVPSRLVGVRLKVHIYDSRIVCYLGTTRVLELERGWKHRAGLAGAGRAVPRHHAAAVEPERVPRADRPVRAPLLRPRPDAIAGLDARGFIIGSVLAYELDVGFVPIRKKGKLPFTTVEETYELEYGSATVEMHTDAVGPGDRVLLIDDLIATGGTMMAGMRLLERLGATVIEGAAIVDLPELRGSDKLRAAGLRLHTLVSFEGF